MADLIDRGAAIQMLSCYAETQQDLDYYRDMLMKIPAVNRWNPCSERLPEYELPVIVAHIDSEGYGLPSIGMFRGNPKKWVTPSAIRIVNVTHWMPLPEPPKE